MAELTGGEIERRRQAGTLVCSCCGDQHGDIGLVDGVLLCFLCQPCPDCGETGSDCDPYGGPAGNSNLCVNRHRVAR